MTGAWLDQRMRLLDIDAVAPVVSAIGTPGIGGDIFRLVNQVMAIQSSIIYRFSGDGVLPISFGTIDQSYGPLQQVSLLYTERFFSFDPNRARVPVKHVDGGYVVTHTERRDIVHSEYLDNCWLKPGNRCRLSLLGWHGDQWWTLNLYRSMDFPRFSEQDVTTLRSLSSFLGAVVVKHLDASAHPAPGNSSHLLLAQRINEFPHLTDREQQVCRGIVRGLTTEGISLELGVAKTSVATYRQRAYAKLGIATRHELLQLCLGAPVHIHRDEHEVQRC